MSFYYLRITISTIFKKALPRLSYHKLVVVNLIFRYLLLLPNRLVTIFEHFSRTANAQIIVSLRSRKVLAKAKCGEARRDQRERSIYALRLSN